MTYAQRVLVAILLILIGLLLVTYVHILKADDPKLIISGLILSWIGAALFPIHDYKGRSWKIVD